MTGDIWTNAMTALRLLSVDPIGLGGIWLRARSGPPRDAFIAAAKAQLPHPWTRIAPVASDETLFGGLDITQTLANGKPTFSKGLLNQGQAVIALTSADRVTPDLAARLTRTLDGRGHYMIALDEGIDDEAAPIALTDRLAFHINLDGLSAADCKTPEPTDLNQPAVIPAAIDDQAIHDLTVLAAKLGIDGLRAPLLAVRAAKASAIADGRGTVEPDDLALAAALVLAPRATILPAEQPDTQEAPPPEPQSEDAPAPASEGNADAIPEDILLEAALAALPPDILEKLRSGASNPQASGTSTHGAVKHSNQKGRPLPPRKGKPDGRRRIDLISTLRSAAPWQPIRRAAGSRDGVHIRAEDIHLRRYQSRSDRLLVFAVDASGSAAMNRLAEAKGAVEILLASAYASRDHVALIAYNKEAAQVLLPPTRSLVRTKRKLAKLPGGGGTPLASGIKTAIEMAIHGRRKGFQPAIVLIADGRANVDLNRKADRARAFEDALSTAKTNATAKIPGVVIDITKRPEPQLEQISQALGVAYVPLPYVDARGLSDLVETNL